MNRRATMSRTAGSDHSAGRPEIVQATDWAGIMRAVGLVESRGASRYGGPAPDDVVFARYSVDGVRFVAPGVRVTSRLACGNAYADKVARMIDWAIQDGVRPGRYRSAALAEAADAGDAGGVAYLEDNLVRPRKMAFAWATEDVAADRLRALVPGRLVSVGPRVIRVYPQDAIAFQGLPDIFVDDLIVDLKTVPPQVLDRNASPDRLIQIAPTWIANPASDAAKVHRPDLYLIADWSLRRIGAVSWATVVHAGTVRERVADTDRLRANGHARKGAAWFHVRYDQIAWARSDAAALIEYLIRDR